jgi:serine protease Do
MRRAKLNFFLFALLIPVILCAGAQGQTKRAPADGNDLPVSFADIVDRVRPAVVNISATTTVKVPGNPFRHFFGPDDGIFGDFLRRQFGDIPDRELKQRSLGSGFVVDREGYIITNNHVVEKADDIKVKLADGREFQAKVVGRDPKTDLALIRLSNPPKGLPVLQLGDSEKMRVGDWVLAIGNPFGLELTVTKGIISATGRVIGSGPYDNFLQTDAPINPGNSGGPLINLKGEVIGINTAIIASGQGIGFAIPSAMTKTVITQLRERGKVVRGWIGISVQDVTPELVKALGLRESRGALVGDVSQGGPSDEAGIRRGDLIVSYDGRDVKSATELMRLAAETPAGKAAVVRVLRASKEVQVTVRVAETPEERAPVAGRLTVKRFGMTVDDLTSRWVKKYNIKDKTGVVVTSVEADGPASEAGLREGDVVKEVNRVGLRNLKDFETILQKLSKKQPVSIRLRRDGKLLQTLVTPR